MKKKLLNIFLFILLAITAGLAIYMIVEGSKMEKPMAATSANLLWSYILIALAIVSALFCAVWGMLKNPTGIKGSLISLAIIVVVIVASYLIAAGRTIEIPDLATGGFFPHNETVIADSSILVTYVALCGTVVAALFSEIYKAFK